MSLGVCGIPRGSLGYQSPSPLQVRFCADVSRETCLQLEQAIQARDEERATWLQHVEGATLPAIHLHVSSNGGSLLSALYAYDRLQRVPNVHTHVEGLAASAATLLTVGGAHRTITRHSMMLVHQPSVAVSGEWKGTDVRDEFVNMQKCTKALLEIYNETTSLPYSDLVTLVQNEQFLTARECLDYGFVDDIV